MENIGGKYGITERKKAELDRLTIQTVEANFKVDRFQAIVSALTDKVGKFQVFLATAESTRTQTLNNRNLINQLVQASLDLENNSRIAFNEINTANESTKLLAAEVNTVIDKLIYSVEMLNKLSNYITRKKALNPLISDNLMEVLANSGKNANNAVALTLVALKSVVTAQASNLDSYASINLTYSQSEDFHYTLTGKIEENEVKHVFSPSVIEIANNPLQGLINTAYINATNHYSLMDAGLTMATNQLNEAQANLDKAQIKLKSLQTGLAAAKAAAFAA